MVPEEHFFSSGAEADFQELYNRYGDVIYHKVDQALTRILAHPKSAPVYFEPIRRLVIQGTPIGLFYGLHGNRIAVIALLDLRQDPAEIRKRLGD